MAELGQTCQLKVIRTGSRTVFLDGGELGEIMLAQSAKDYRVGDQLDAFVYIDADDTVMASTQLPDVVAHQVACLEVVSLTKSGAYLDWGMQADLFMPRSEQLGDMRIGSKVVALALVDDDSERLIATARLYQHLADSNDGEFTQHQQVDLLVSQRTELGYKVVVNGTHLGMLYHNEIFTRLRIGDELKGFVKAPREDGKLDIALQRPGRQKHTGVEASILEHLEANNGSSTITDKSAPAEIYQTFGVSKKAYKQALGALYKARRVVVTKEKISLVEEE